MSAFEDFVNLELPRRPTLLTQEITSYQGDPNAGGAPSIIQNSPKGTFYLNNSDAGLWRKTTASVGSWQLVGGGSKDETTAPITYYVNGSSGNDANDGLTSGSAFATIQHAISLIPRVIRHLVTVNVASGNYQGFFIAGRTIDPAPDPTNSLAGIYVVGSYVTATVATGSATGVLTSTTTGGDVNSPTPTVVGDSVNALTVNNVKGKLLKMTSGANVGTILPILSNTATTITVCFNEALGAIGDTYTILDWGTIIDSATQAGGFLDPPSPNLPSDPDVGIGVSNNTMGYFQGITVQGFKVHIVSEDFLYSVNVAYSTGQTTFLNCHLSAGYGIAAYINGSQTFIRSSVIDADNADPSQAWFAYLADGNGGRQQMVSTMITASTGNNPNPAFQIQPDAGVSFLGEYVYVENYVIGVKVIGNLASTIQFSGSSFTMTGSEGILCTNNLGHNNNSSIFLFLIGTSFNGCSSALLLDHTVKGHIVGVSGSTNTTGFDIQTGARIKCDPTTTLTGSTEISLDGVPTTLSAMRGATPKLLTNSYGTIIYE